ncbi:MAG: chemotaxis protein CheB [Bacteroidia bacterium]
MEKIIVIGASLGGFDIFRKILGGLPADYPWPVVAVQHRTKSGRNELTELLHHETRISVKEAEDKEKPLPGTAYFAPANYHLLIGKDRHMALDISEKLNYSRPSIDALFESAAEALGQDLVAILLSGANHDGSAGLKMVQDLSGTIIVQDPAEADAPEMPLAGIAAADPDRIYTVSQILDYLLLIK